jgi:hypothetical protein
VHLWDGGDRVVSSGTSYADDSDLPW